MLQLIISPFVLLLTLTTSTGIFVHESKIDALATLALTPPAAAVTKLANGKLLESMPHTHSDTGTFESSSREYRAKTPSITPRRDRDEKYRLQRNVPRGYHLFDSYHLPLAALS